MKRGEVWTVSSGEDFTGKPRPALVVQDDLFLSTVAATFLPLTSQAPEPSMLRIAVEPTAGNGLRETSVAQVNRITTVRLSKVGRRIGQVDEEVMLDVDRALAAYLGLAS